MYRVIFMLTGLFLVGFHLRSQPAGNALETFNEAQFFYSRGDYEEAAYYYRQLVALYTDHANFNFKLGECYLNIPGSERMAITSLKIAVTRTVQKKKYKAKDFNEVNAPLHAYFYLGNAYRYNNQLDEALLVYDTFVNSPHYFGNYNLSIVENEIQSCERARVISDNPIGLQEELLDSTINTSSSELNPVVSADGHTMLFIRRLQFYDAIYQTTLKNGLWSRPENLNAAIGSDGDLYPACLSPDGTTLFLIRNDAEDKDIYVSYLSGGSWSKAEILSRKVNSRRDETSAFQSLSGTVLYFSSFRRGGEGGSDLYYSVKDVDGQWGRGHTLGKSINTAFDERDPCLTNDDNTLYFSSRGHNNMGGFDIFYSNQAGDQWDTPVNAGYPLNDTGDNTGFTALEGGRTGYYSRINLKDASGEDIYKVKTTSNLPSPE